MSSRCKFLHAYVADGSKIYTAVRARNILSFILFLCHISSQTNQSRVRHIGHFYAEINLPDAPYVLVRYQGIS